MKLWPLIISSQKGIALPIVLALLALGGLIIVPTLNYAATSLNHCRIIKTGTEGIYAAEAGIEYAIWNIQKGLVPPSVLPQSVNGLNVSLATDNHGNQTYTLYMGAFVQTSGHFSYLRVTGSIVWVESEDAYQYTITVQRQASPTIFLDQVGARLPDGFTYQAGSAARFSGNLSMDEPRIIDDGLNYMVNWGDPNRLHKKISSDSPLTQTFYIHGTGERRGQYAWVVAQPDSIDVVGEITGTVHEITSTATDPDTGQIVSCIASDVMVINGNPKIVSWKISK